MEINSKLVMLSIVQNILRDLIIGEADKIL